MVCPRKSIFISILTLTFAFADPAEKTTLRTGVSLVTIPVHVTTERGTSLTNLVKDDFQLFEDNIRQTIVSFSKQDAPVSVGFLLDSSGSMKNRMRTASEAATAFCKTANPEDEFFLIHFGERPKLDIPFTNDPGEIFRRISRVKAFGRTSLLDAIYLALGQMKQARHSRKAIVILSDGGDNRSRRTSGQIRIAMSESGVQVYAMGIFETRTNLRQSTPEEKNGPELLTALADMTGGHHYPVSNFADLPLIGERIGMDLRNEYVLGYVSTNPILDGKFRSVKLSVGSSDRTPPLRAQYRRGYYAPLE